MEGDFSIRTNSIQTNRKSDVIVLIQLRAIYLRRSFYACIVLISMQRHRLSVLSKRSYAALLLLVRTTKETEEGDGGSETERPIRQLKRSINNCLVFFVFV